MWNQTILPFFFTHFFLWIYTGWYTLHCLRNREYKIMFTTHTYLRSLANHSVFSDPNPHRRDALRLLVVRRQVQADPPLALARRKQATLWGHGQAQEKRFRHIIIRCIQSRHQCLSNIHDSLHKYNSQNCLFPSRRFWHSGSPGSCQTSSRSRRHWGRPHHLPYHRAAGGNATTVDRRKNCAGWLFLRILILFVILISIETRS